MGNYNHHMERSFAPASEIYFGTAVMYSNVTFRDTFSTTSCAITFYSDNGITQQIAITTNALGQWVVYCGATQIATSIPLLQAGKWVYLEAWVVVADTGGRCVLKIDGVTVINFTGDTRNAGTSPNLDKVKLSAISNYNTDQYWDDMYLCDATGTAPYNTFLGDCRVLTLSPTGTGSSTQLTPDTGSNYARVNEIPYSAANYVSGATPTLRDTYVMSDLPANVATIYGVQNNVIAKRTSTGAIALKPTLKVGASIYYGATNPVTPNDTTYSDLRTANPATSTTWTVSDINALESGLEIA